MSDPPVDPRQSELDRLRHALERLERRVERIEQTLEDGAASRRERAQEALEDQPAVVPAARVEEAARPQPPPLPPDWIAQSRARDSHPFAGSPGSAVVAPPALPIPTARLAPPRDTGARAPGTTGPPGAPSRSLETLIGQNWASWVGGIVLFLGIVFFLKYAWDQGWVRLSATARVVAAVALGVALGGLGEWAHRRRLRVLAGSLYGVGFAVAAAAFFAASVYFDPPVLPRGAAFACVAVAAAVAIAASLHIDSIVLAMLGLIGAYASPFVLSSGPDQSLFLLSYLLVLAVTGWTLNHLRRDWFPLRWLTLICTYASLFAWWASTGERNDHHTLALAFTCAFYAGFVIEMILALRSDSGESVAIDSPAPRAPQRALHATLAVMSLLVTAATFAMLGWLYGAEAPRVLGAFAVGLAGTQVFAATFTRSMPWRLGAILQAAALVTVAVPLVLDQFAVTLAWLALAMVLSLLAWRLDLAAARAWSAVLLGLAVARLLVFDSFDPALRAVQFTIAGQPITRWLLLGWSIAALFHVVAWLKPRGREASHLLDSWIPTLGASRISRALSYATATRAIAIDDALDPGGAVLAVLGTLLFAGVTAMRWDGAMLTLGLVAWLAPIALLARAGRHVGYGAHAAVLAVLLSVRWIVFDNLQPLVDTWSRGQSLPPILNLPALSGVLLAGAVLLVCWDEKLLGLKARDHEREIRPANALSPRRFAIIIAAVIGFALLNFEIWRAIDWLDAGGRIAITDRAIVKQVSMSVLWAVLGFAGVVAGFRRDIPAIRWAALALLAITLAKILVIDMAEVKAIWRILSFVAVGALLLAVSFVYHRQSEGRSAEEV